MTDSNSIISGQFVKQYFENFKLYALEKGMDLNSNELKEQFYDGLTSDNKKRTIRFGKDKPLDEIVEYLDRISAPPSDRIKFIFGELVQGSDSVMAFYLKMKKCNQLVGLCEDHFKINFLRGLSPKNQLEADICELELPLDELVSRLDALEKIDNSL